METFTAVGFGIQDVNEPFKFAKHVPLIFDFMKSISSNEYHPTNEIIKTILNFSADMINLYGHEIKALVQQEFLMNNLKKLKEVRSKKLESTIKWVEEVFILFDIRFFLQ